MKMKYIACLVLSLLLVSCAAPRAAGGSGDPSLISAGENPASANKLEMYTSVHGASTFVAGKNGFYEVDSAAGHGNILYTDFETRTRVFLCNRPDCAHNAEGCTSYLGDNIFSGKLFVTPDNTQLFLMSSYNLDLGIPERLWSMDMNGENRALLYSLAPHEMFVDAVAGDGRYLYVTVDVTYADSQTQGKELRKIDLSTKKAEVLLRYEEAGWLSGVLDEDLIMSYTQYTPDGNYSDHIFTLYSLTTKEETEIVRFTNDRSLSVGQQIGFMMYGQSVLTLETTSSAACNLYKTDLRTKEKTLVCENIPTPDTARVIVYLPVDGHLLLDAGEVDLETYTVTMSRYAVNLKTGELRPLLLSFASDPAYGHIRIEAAYKDYYYVAHDMQMREITLVGNEGVPYTDMAGIPVYAMMLKSDFWSNKPNYIPITDTVTS